MGFISKLFGSKDTTDQIAVAPRQDDFLAALSLHLNNDLDPALSAYRQICAAKPNDNLAPFFAAAITACQGNIADATEQLRTLSRRIAMGEETISLAIARDLFDLVGSEAMLKVPTVAEIIIAFGDRLKTAGLVQESAVCFEIAVGLLPEHASVLHKLGDTLHDLRMYDYAESVLLKALEYAPNHWGALYTYAVLLQDLGRFAEAITYYEKAVTLNPDHPNCQNNYGAALMLTNRLAEALEHCTVAAGLDPDSPWVKVNLGNIHLLRQEYEIARTCFTTAISLEGNLAEAYFGLGSVAQLTGSDAESIQELYRKAIALNPAMPDFHHALGNLLASEGNPEALSCFATAAHLNGNLKNLQRDFGKACLELARKDEALAHLRLALQQNPDDVLARELLARAE